MSQDQMDKDINQEEVQQSNSHSPQDTTFPTPGSKTFTAHDFSALSQNEHYRYAPNSQKIAHAVITQQDGQSVALQYDLPSGGDEETPSVRPLVDIEAIEPFRGMHRFRARTPDGHTPMYAKRFIYGKVGEHGNEEPIQIACFSPSPETGKPPFWGSIKKTPVFSENLSKTARKDLKKELADIKSITKGGKRLNIDPDSVRQRDRIKTRTPGQNQVMGESARDAYEHFFDSMASELHPDMKKRLKRAFKAELKANLYKNSYRPEWLHLYGWSLMPMDKDPQIKDNLAAAPKWANTEMMILERIVKWFALNAPDSLSSIQSTFEMLLDSELAHQINFEARIQIKERYVELMQTIDPFLAYPLFRKASDLAQGAGITYNILNDIAPINRQLVQGARIKKGGHFSSKKGSSILTNTQRAQMNTEASQQQYAPPPSDDSGQSDLNRRKRRRNTDGKQNVCTPTTSAKKQKTFPTQDQHERSVVQVYSQSFIPDYNNPWRGPESMSCSGSGFIVQDTSGKKYVMTNAHVAENATFLQVRLANQRVKKYEATVKCVSYQCDLALLEVDDPEFLAFVEPVELVLQL